jgi:hypothetical protein
MAYLMKFNRKVASVVGDEVDPGSPNDPTKRFFAKGKIYVIQPNDAVHFIQSGLAEFANKGKKKR